MKLVKAMLVGALIASFGLLASNVMADTVTVSSSAVTTIRSGNTGRKTVCMQNTSYLNVYFSKTSSSATVAAGNVLAATDTYHPVQSLTCLSDYSGPIYGLSQGTASVDIRYFEIAR